MFRCKYEVEEHRILSREEEQELFKKYEQTKEISVRNYIVKHYFKFAVACAKCFVRKYFYIDPRDLSQYSMLGLLAAVEKFDWRRERRFTTIAAYEIKAAINRHVECNESTVRYSADLHRKMQYAASNDFMTPKMEIAYQNILGCTSIDMPISDGGTLGDVLEDERSENVLDKLSDRNMVNLVREIIETELDDREKLILNTAFGLDGSEPGRLRDLAPKLKCSPDYVRYLKSQVMKKVKDLTEHLVED